MKKAIVSVLCVVLVLSLSVVAFVACDKQDNKASNSEVLGTAVAVAASQLGGAGASTASTDAADDDFTAGINLNVGSDTISATAGASIKGIGSMVQPIVESAVNSVDKFLGDNGISVTKVDSDDADYSEKYAISFTYVDEATGESMTEEYALYVKLDEGVELEGKKDYTFTAKVAKIVKQEGKEDIKIDLTSFSGKANFDTAKDAMVFTLGAIADCDAASAFANIQAYSTAKGTIVLEMGAGAGISGTANAEVNLSIELGKLADNKYGAIVTVTGDTSVAGYGVKFTLVANVSANSAEDAKDFAINGNLNATVNVPVLGAYNATADLTGKAQYNVEKDTLEVGLTGNVSLVKADQE